MKYMETKKYNKLNIARTLQKIKFSSMYNLKKN